LIRQTIISGTAPDLKVKHFVQLEYGRRLMSTVLSFQYPAAFRGGPEFFFVGDFVTTSHHHVNSSSSRSALIRWQHQSQWAPCL